MKLKQQMATSAARALKYCVAGLAATAMVVVLIPNVVSANTPLPHAAFTTTNPTSADGPGHCQNGNEAVNCNIYDGKQYVWLNGGPVQGQLDNGEYFFAVLVPGGQGGHENPNDCTPLNLSDFTPCDTSNTGAGDTWQNRVFSVQDHVITYTGTHDFGQGTNVIDQNKIRLMPYDDTTNNGGVYILAICSLADANPDTHNGLEPGVDPSDCKYDAFKVNSGETVPAATDLVITKDAKGSYNTTYKWNISKCTNVGQDCVSATKVQKVGGTATFTYTVHVTHDAGTPSDIKVTGTITVTNPNEYPNHDTVPVDFDSVTDQLSDNTNCTVKDATNSNGDPVSASGGTLIDFKTYFPYECSLTSLPQGALNNTADVSWLSQQLDNGAFLAGSDAKFTFTDVSFTETLVDNCTTVTDPVPTGGTSGDNPFPKTVCVGDSGDGGAGTGSSDGFTFVYHVTYNVPTNDCKDFTNTATESTDSNSSSVTVTLCGPAKTGALTIGFWKTTNGQGLIGTYCQAANGTTALGTYLATLGTEDQGPFKDAGAVTTCAALKTYVYNILNGATATDMNKMLKAQMLGTALDVWFSGPGWSSTKIGSVKPPSNFLQHNNLGTFNMDTTAVCPMVDNLNTGSATCKLGLPSTDAVTAGAVPTSPMSMQAILDFAASWTTGGGAFIANSSPNAWYGTPSTGANRTKQEILKNIFDQFNNQQAFGSF